MTDKSIHKGGRSGGTTALLLGVMLVVGVVGFGISQGASKTGISKSSDEAWAPQSFELDNGMEVVVIPDHRVPVVTHMVWYRVGSADEPRGKSGIAHYLEHLMFKGTDTIPPGEFSKIVARNGGRDNAFTSYDYTAYFQRMAVDRLPLIMEMEADRMTNLKLVDEVVLPERSVILEERRQRTDNEPLSLLSERVNAALYLHHPYGVPIIGWKHEIQKLDREDAISFYKKHYAPNNAILVVAGDITAEELRPLAEKYYGVIPPGDIVDRVRVSDPPVITSQRVVLKDARAKQARVTQQLIVPSYRTAEEGEAEALEVLAQILGGGSTSRMYQEVVVDKKLGASAGTWYQGGAVDDGKFGVFAVPRAGVDINDVEAALIASVDKLIAEGVTGEELERAKNTLVAEAVYARDSQQSMAYSLGSTITTGSTVEDFLAWPDRISAVTADQVNAVAKKYLVRDRAVTGILLPVAENSEDS